MASPLDPIRSSGALHPGAPEYPGARIPPPYPNAAVPQPKHPCTKEEVPPPSVIYPVAGHGSDGGPAAQPHLAAGPLPGPGDGSGKGITSGPGSAERHPHDIHFSRPGRVHLADRQRRADATAVGQLLLYLPSFVFSLLIVVTISYALLSNMAWAVILLWVASGALAFHRPTESVFARHLLNLRHPTQRERARLEPVWREVAARAGVEGRAYELWIEDSDKLNALAVAGHIVSVTRFSLENLPSGQLAAVLAHELGHHVGGHAWSSLLGEWYAVPGRLAWAATRKLAQLGLLIGRRANGWVALALCAILGGIVMPFALSYWFVILALIVAPYPLAAIARRTELRADQHAATLGFGPMLAEVLHTMHTEGSETECAATAAFSGRAEAGALGTVNQAHGGQTKLLRKLLSLHPDYHTRLHHLAPYLASHR
jgi:Zn-dependent protease with chaperone function